MKIFFFFLHKITSENKFFLVLGLGYHAAISIMLWPYKHKIGVWLFIHLFCEGDLQIWILFQ